MKGLFELAAGSIAGTNHLRTGKNNQDAYYSYITEEMAIAIVSDGCGSGKHSEVGAKIGVRLVAAAIERHLAQPSNHFWEEVRQEVLDQLETLVRGMGGNLSETVNDYFLFTIVGALILPSGVTTFALGDGAIALNEEILSLGPFADNAPPYLAYGLLERSASEWQFQIHHQLPIAEVSSILIGTDGVIDLIQGAEKNLPGKPEIVSTISQFWQEDRYFMNSDMVRRRLALINNEVIKPDWQNHQITKSLGLLSDDTTLIAIRKRS